ncbi:alpha/beta fold hydrolase [Sulfitobacter donghicola]|uniref:Alpha/beta hydrolase n=1 Tax=Sulfitobacter donghicola DSW-25 = KCTC 12864 = JCM 14565 TaxID=1300350 RepID=A0A073ILL9_9RHOB|nr:alpha/beta hydrolase [Sulfitobacter donghicola]KEJ90470.1 alpha/beta hydrolase [Sulfitobacter donghicola DSW-25 = KCTC 12864 = JCM 14565]KIN67708.1 putative alpha/beta hydrolase [Sulfitobacter donghicola DSW-25 = KCTC 12864 = JCM 14565]
MIWIFLFLLAAIAAAPFALEHYRTQMNDGRRGSAPGLFVELSQGTTHYRLNGPSDGPLIVCVHGLTSPSFVWGELAKELVDNGFRVLTYDLYGRGYSDRPHGAQDKAFFNNQLNDLLEYLEVEEPFHLMGYSMGGAVAAGFASTFPTRVRRLILIASAGFVLPSSKPLHVIQDQGLAGNWLLLAAYPKQLRSGIRAEQESGTAPPQISQAQEAELEYQGFLPAVLSSLRGILRHPLEGEHLSIAKAEIPVLAIWAEEDDTIPASAMGQLAAWNRNAIHEVIEDAGHGVTYTHSEQVLDLIGGFLPLPAGDDWGHDQ